MRGISIIASEEPIEDVLERSLVMWDLSSGFPLPKWDVACPCCQTTNIQLRHFHFHERKDSKTRYRCDVNFKCRMCGMVWVHGVIVPQAFYEEQTQKRSFQTVNLAMARLELRGNG